MSDEYLRKLAVWQDETISQYQGDTPSTDWKRSEYTQETIDLFLRVGLPSSSEYLSQELDKICTARLSKVIEQQNQHHHVFWSQKTLVRLLMELVLHVYHYLLDNGFFPRGPFADFYEKLYLAQARREGGVSGEYQVN